MATAIFLSNLTTLIGAVMKRDCYRPEVRKFHSELAPQPPNYLKPMDFVRSTNTTVPGGAKILPRSRRQGNLAPTESSEKCYVHIVGPKRGVVTRKAIRVNEPLRSECLAGSFIKPNCFDLWDDENDRLLNCQKTVTELGIVGQSYRIRIVEQNRSDIVDAFIMDIRKSVPDELDEDPSDDKKPLLEIIKKLRNERAYVKQLVRRIAVAIKILHDKEIVHLGLGLNSIFVNSDGIPYLSKLWYMESVKNSKSITEIAYDVQCMAPEILGVKSGSGFCASLKMDIYAFGVIVYQIVTRTIVEEDSQDLYVFAKTIFEGNNWIENVSFDSPYRDLVLRCMDHNPRRRPSIDECIELIDAIE